MEISGMKENVVIYGLGNYFSQYEKEINDSYNVKVYADRVKREKYDGKEIVSLEDIMKHDFDKLIIMVWSINECIHIIKDLILEGVNFESIILGHDLYGRYSKAIDKISVLPDGKLMLMFHNISVKVRTEDEFHNVCEVFLEETYNYFINNEKRDIVLDVGMNVGDAAMYFADYVNVTEVYGFEPFKETFLMAQENLKDYYLKDKIKVFQYGISNENAKRVIAFNSNMTCGQSTIKDVREKSFESYLEWGLVNTSNEQMEEISVRKASEIFIPIIRRYPDHNIILKMDCEGEEYGILEELFKTGILGEFKLIMLEWHYRGKDIIFKYLDKAGFSYFFNDKNENMGLIYAYK